MGDWLGTGTIATQTKSGEKPVDIPANPNRTYFNKGWAGYPDWLGYLPVR
jgi:hypothetical protein